MKTRTLKWLRLMGLCLSSLLSTPALADDLMTNFYDNTLTCQGTKDDNWLCYIWYYRGGYYREFEVIRRRDGNASVHGYEGTFSVKQDGGNQILCQSHNDSEHSWCHRLVPRQTGDKWVETLAGGRTQKFTLVKGRQLLNYMTGGESTDHVLTPYVYPDYPPDPSKAVRDLGTSAR